MAERRRWSWRHLWRDHSLSVTTIGSGVVLVGASIPLREGTAFDILSAVGVGLATAGLVFALSGPLCERNRPEEPPPGKEHDR
jgi:hypothetical protein